MTPLYAGIGGVVRELTDLYTGVGGVVKPMTEMWAGVGGVNRQIFSAGTPCTIEYSLPSSEFIISVNGQNYTDGSGTISANVGDTAIFYIVPPIATDLIWMDVDGASVTLENYGDTGKQYAYVLTGNLNVVGSSRFSAYTMSINNI